MLDLSEQREGGPDFRSHEKGGSVHTWKGEDGY